MIMQRIALGIALSASQIAFAQTGTTKAPARSVPPTAAELKRQLDSSAPAWLKAADVPSVSVAYIEHGKVAWTAAYGEQSAGVPATVSTMYNIASLTKPITAETILRLASKGKLSLDEPMSPFWIDPDIKGNPWADLLTPRIALTHQTGFANWRRMTNKVLTFKFQPGTQMGYSGEGYQYAAKFTENKIGVPFPDLAQQNVFAPLGMKDTSYLPQSRYDGRIAQPHVPGTSPDPADVWRFNAADLVHTTAADYARFVISVMHNQSLTGSIAQQRSSISRDLVTPEDKTKLCAHDSTPDTCTVAFGMGLGWEVQHFDGAKILQHTGSDTGFRSMAMFVPESGTGIVILTNGDAGNKVIKQVVGLLYPNRLLLATMEN
jgi:CubicO group peptidase (beta-lactamase class C family)